MMSLCTTTQRKESYGYYVQKLADSDVVKSFLSNKLGSGSKLVQYSSRYKHESLQILSYQFSSMGGKNTSVVLQMSVMDYYTRIGVELDHLAQTGTGFVILDNSNRVCCIAFMFDVCDEPIYTATNRNQQRLRQISSTALQRDALYQKYVAPYYDNKVRRTETKYGQIANVHRIAIRPDMLHRGLMTFKFGLLIPAMMGYSMMYQVMGHPRSIASAVSGSFAINQTVSKVIRTMVGSEFDFSRFVFDDGTSTEYYYENLKRLGYDVEHIKSHRSKMAVVFRFVKEKLTVDKAIDVCKNTLVTVKNARESKL